LPRIPAFSIIDVNVHGNVIANDPGDAMGAVTIADVAREAGVSIQTVSRVLNNKGEVTQATRRTVLEVIERLGYRPNGVARSLVTRRTLMLGLVVPDIANPFFPEIARGAEDLAARAGYGVVLCNTVEQPAREEAALQLLADKRVDGVIVCSARLPDDQLHPLLARYRAAVLVNRVGPRALAGVVRVDDEDGARQAVVHLLDRGRRVVAILAGPPNSRSGHARVRGACAALAGAGAPVDPALIIPCTPDLAGGDRACREVLAGARRVDALLCYNDLVAVGALQACRDLGVRVPDDLAVVGNDDILLAGLIAPALTTLRVSKYEIGAAAMQMLLRRVAGRSGKHEHVVRPELIVRAST
jgi:LacI family transcriptional regulator